MLLHHITLANINLLYMKNEGTQWTMVSYLKNKNIEERKRSWGPFRIYQLISTANTALFEWNWAELILFFFKYETIVH